MGLLEVTVVVKLQKEFQTVTLQIFSKSNLFFHCVTNQQYQFVIVIFVSYHTLNLGAALKKHFAPGNQNRVKNLATYFICILMSQIKGGGQAFLT